MKRWLLLVVAVFALVGVGSPAFAHNTLSGASPANGSTVDSSPAQVTVTFGEPVQQGSNEITVTGPDGKGEWQQTSTATVDGDSVRAPLRELGPAGKYTIGYRIISADGHPVSGSTSFTLRTAGHGTPAAAQASTPDGGGSSGVPLWVWLVLAVLVLGGGVFVALRLTKPAKR